METGIPPKAVDFCPVNKIEDANPWLGLVLISRIM